MTTSRRPRLSLSLLAAATSLTAAIAAPAFAQDGSNVLNEQVLNGSIFADTDLQVEEATEGLVSSTAAVGNSVAASTENQDLGFVSSQTVRGTVNANSYVQARGTSGEVFVNNTSATGNTGDASTSGGYLGTDVYQTVENTGRVNANAYSAVGATVGYASGGATAIGNSQGYAAHDGSVGARTVQENYGGATASNESVFCCITGSGTFTSTAVSNNVTSHVENGEVRNDVVQVAGGPTRALNDTYVVTGNYVTGSATATANTVSSYNTGGYAELKADQLNTGPVSAESYVALENWYGTGASIAYGVGNSADLVNISPDPVMHTSQVNDGHVSSVALFDGGSGEHVFTSATSVGNAVSGYACSTCYGVIDATNRQVNNGTVRASARTYVGGSAGYVTSTSSAIGNAASYESRTTGQ